MIKEKTMDEAVHEWAAPRKANAKERMAFCDGFSEGLLAAEESAQKIIDEAFAKPAQAEAAQ
jgi:hypothetical protein